MFVFASPKLLNRFQSMYSRLGRLALLLVALVAAPLGCGPTRPPMIPVSGKVTLNDQPLAGAAVALIPAGDGKPAVATTQADGSFTLRAFDDQDGVLPGKYRATVALSRVTNVAVTPDGLSGLPGPGGPMIEWVTPERYSNPDSSGLTATVEPGMAPLHFKLTSP